jgi:hypothetical protein
METSDDVALRAAVQNACLKLLNPTDGTAEESNIKVKNSAVMSIAELTYIYATQCLGPDLVAFAQHRKASTSSSTTSRAPRITAEDVLLVARKNPAGVHDQLQAFLQDKRQQVATATAANNSNNNNGKSSTMPQRAGRKSMSKEKPGEAVEVASSEEEDLDHAIAELKREKKNGFTLKPAGISSKPSRKTTSKAPPSTSSSTSSSKRRRKKRKVRSPKKKDKDDDDLLLTDSQSQSPPKKVPAVKASSYWSDDSDAPQKIVLPMAKKASGLLEDYLESSDDDF